MVASGTAPGRSREEAVAGGGVHPRHTAVVVIDMIHGCVDAHLSYVAAAAREEAERRYYPERMASVVLPNHARLLPAARAAGLTVAYSVLGSHSTDFADMSPNLRGVVAARGVHRGAHGFAILDEVAPARGDVVVTKLGSGVWETTDLDDTLRARGVDHVVLTGTVTNGCVLTTALGAWDRGYRVWVVEDTCCTLSASLHRRALELLEGCGVTALATAAVLDALARATAPDATVGRA